MREILLTLYPVLGVSLYVAYFLVVWLKTNAFAEYLTLFRLSRFCFVDSYNELVKNGYEEGYAHFLKEYYHDYFIIRLLTCPICFGFWIAIPWSLHGPGYLFAIPLGLFFYGVFNKLL